MMSRRYHTPEVQVELLRRRYLQLQDPLQLPLPMSNVLKAPEIQSLIYKTMFRQHDLVLLPPARYRLRVLKRILQSIEQSLSDPDEDEFSDDLTACMATLMSETSVDPSFAAQQRHYVTYTLPTTPLAVTETRTELYPPPVPSATELSQRDASSSPFECLPRGTITLLESHDVLASAGTTGRRTWEAALCLASLLLGQRWRSRIARSTVIELGAGTGLLSILCARFLSSNFTLATDGSSEVVDDLEKNFFLNGLENSGNIKSTVLKWGHAAADGIVTEHTFDLVIGSDLIYDRDTVSPLVVTLRELLNRNLSAQAIVSATVRNEKTLELFEMECSSSSLIMEQLHVYQPELDRQMGFFYAISMPIRLYLISSADGPK